MQQHQETHPQKGEHGSGCGNLVLVRNQGTASWLQTPLGGTPPSPLQPWHSGVAVSDGAPSFSSRGICWVLGLMREGQSLCNTTSRPSSPPCPTETGHLRWRGPAVWEQSADRSAEGSRGGCWVLCLGTLSPRGRRTGHYWLLPQPPLPLHRHWVKNQARRGERKGLSEFQQRHWMNRG